jgi:catechol 2,3-dioxygenase-like lactoylglutathione lyase family enzyme
VSVHHAALETAPGDRDALVAFFALLGFEEVAPPPSLRGAARWVQRGATQVHVLFADGAGGAVVPPYGHVAVVAPDYDAALGRLRAAGYEPDPRREHWGSPRCFVRAPGGHRVEVMAFPPGAALSSAGPGAGA